ncbi:MAG: hypothetical protein JRF45_09455 [Deltaproteobacteria bacterium]|jgi:hypothetical protein|nr:hypothetical protein [Deltaproteobacteria bacterium]MBW1970428.1 hypothetical protein [Deltaproteobacteria bacterium]MBW2157262.1 hypothetical protein [Deltaproteobacteria bacterium]MBW2326692.1 hypothetical protein [Deltaproteobacteria bacterium]
MKSEVATVRRVTLSRDEVEEAIIEHIEAFHDPQLTSPDDYDMSPILQARMFA